MVVCLRYPTSILSALYRWDSWFLIVGSISAYLQRRLHRQRPRWAHGKRSHRREIVPRGLEYGIPSEMWAPSSGDDRAFRLSLKQDGLHPWARAIRKGANCCRCSSIKPVEEAIQT